MKHFFWVLTLVGICAGFISSAHADDAAERGRYLAILGDCAGCHTVAHRPAYTGGLAFNAPFGTVYSTNITPDRETGIGAWTAEDFYRALHEGIAPGGRHLYPALPYIYFTRISRRESDDLFAFLHTLTPVHRPPTPNKLIFPFNLRFVVFFWDWLYLDRKPPQLPAQASAQWRRGEYLVNGLGHCAACHTPKDILFGDEKTRPLGGGLVDHWFANDLTGGQRNGLGKWSLADVTKFLATGINSHASAAGSMAEKVSSSTSRMRESDRLAIAAYLKSLAASPIAASETPRPEQMARGNGVFTAYCQNCHAVPVVNTRTGYPNLPGNTLLMGYDPTTVVRIILQGGPAPATPHLHPKPMPGFARLDDGQIADVASFIRNAWGNSAAPVSATQVHNLRQALAAP